MGDGLVFRTKGTWPRTSALYCHPVPAGEWPVEPEIVERVPLRSCARRGAAIDVVADRGREQPIAGRVHPRPRPGDGVLAVAAHPQAGPSGRAGADRAGAGIAELEIVVDAHERYAYRFAGKPVRTLSRGLACGDYAVAPVRVRAKLVAAVERKSLPDLVSSLTSGRLRFALGELAALPRAAVVVEDRYSQVFTLDRVRPALVADGLAELQVRWPTIPIVFCETRALAEEWTYRYLAAAAIWARTESAALARIAAVDAERTGGDGADGVDPQPEPSTAEIRSWARAQGIVVPERGRLGVEIRAQWNAGHQRRPPGGPADQSSWTPPD